MTKLRPILCFSILAIVAFGVNVQAGGDAVAFGNGEVTTSQAAVFAAFLAWLPNEDQPNFSADTAISVSSILGSSLGLWVISMIALETGKAPSSFFFGIEMGPRCGTRRPRIRRGLVWTRWGISGPAEPIQSVWLRS